MNITDKDYKKWLNYSKIITNNKEADDLLHDLIIRFIRYKTDPNIITDNYVFISLKYLYLTKTKKNKKNILEYSNDLLSNVESDEIDIHSFINDNNDKQSKLDCISKTVLSLNDFERKLYQLHFIYGLSQRKIAREISVSHMVINERINRIKQKIKDSYEKE